MSQLNAKAPSLPLPGNEYEREYFDKLTNVLRLYFNQLDNPGPIGATSLNFDLNNLPTETSLGTLRVGDVYRDTTASNVLKVKV
jgi:hypothetical protein